MPIYEYKGQQYEMSTEDPAQAKAKILDYLSKQAAPRTAQAPQSAQEKEPAPEPSFSSAFDMFPPLPNAVDMSTRGNKETVVDWANRTGAFAKMPKPAPEQFDPRMAEFLSRRENVEKLEEQKKLAESKIRYLNAPTFSATPQEVIEAQKYKPDLGATGIDATLNFLQRGAQQGLTGYEQGVRGLNLFAQEAFGLETEQNRKRLNQLQNYSQALGENPYKPLQIMEGAIASISQQLPVLVPGVLTGSEGLVLSGMFVQSFGQDYQESRRRGLDATDATGRAILNATFEVIGEKFGLGANIKAIKAAVKGKPLDQVVDYYAKALAREIPGEELTYAGRFGTDKFYGLNPEAGIKQFLEGALDTALVTVAQTGTMMAGTTGLGKGLQAASKAKQTLDARLAARDAKGYEKDTSYEGLSEYLARRHGFLTPSQQQPDLFKAAAQPDLGAVGEARPGAEEAEAPAPVGVPDGYKREQRAAQVQARTQELMDTLGIPERDAQAIAEADIFTAEAKATRTAPTTEAPSNRVEDLTQQFIDAGERPDVASQRAIAQAQQEAEDDRAAEAQTAVPARPVESAGGVSVPMVEQPGAVTVPAGAGRAEPSRVVSAEQPAGKPATGEAEQPGALTGEPIVGNTFDSTGWTEQENKINKKTGQPTLGPGRKRFIKVDADGTTHNVLTQDGVVSHSITNSPVITLTNSVLADEGESVSGRIQVDGRTGNLVFVGEGERGAVLKMSPRAKQRYQEGVPFNKIAEEEFSDAGGIRPDGTRTPHTTTSVLEKPSTSPTPKEAPKGKRGRPVVLTEEERKQKREASKPVQAAKARADRAIKRLETTINETAKPLEDTEFDSDDERLGAKRAAVKELLQLKADPNLRGTKVAERIKKALEHPSITAKERADLQAGIDALKAQEKASSSQQRVQSPVDTTFSKFTTAKQAVDHIIKTGNKVQRAFARRLKNFVKDVEFVVIEEGQKLPDTLARHAGVWEGSLGLFIENYDTGARAIYVRGASFGEDQGINNVTMLHELFHAATNRKIALAEEAIVSGKADTELVRAYKSLLRTMRNAQNAFAEASSEGSLSTAMAELYDSTDGLMVADPQEFLAYGMTDEGMQDFLAATEGFAEEPSLLSNFVRSIRMFFGIPKSEHNALTNLISATDSILRSKAPKVTVKGEQASQMFGFGKKEDEFGEGEKRRAAPSANVERLSTMLGSKLYGSPEDIARVSTKELFQNSFDAIKEGLEKGQITEGKINIDVDEKARTLRITDNGPGMPNSVMGNQFLQIAGTVKGTKRASGGFGVAKMLFLFENKKLEVVSLRDGVLSRMVTTGEDLKAALSDPSRGPEIETTTDPKTIEQFKKTLFPDGHGTTVMVQVPESFVDSSTGETKNIRFSDWEIRESSALERSPLFDNIEVVFKSGKYPETLPIGKDFPIDKYTPFANVKFAWGTARVYVSKGKPDRIDWVNNTYILSNGLWQFSTALKDKPGWDGGLINHTFYIDVAPNPNVRPEDPGYPFDLNRQRFSSIAEKDFQNIFNYITVLYGQVDLASEVKNFGTVQYVNADGSLTTPTVLEPKTPPTDNAFTLIKPGDDVEVKDGVLYVNNRAVPELTNEDLKKVSIRVDELTIPQNEIDPQKVMIHDNTARAIIGSIGLEDFGWTTDVRNGEWTASKDGKTYTADTSDELVNKVVREGGFTPPSISDAAREQFGARYDKYLARIGDTFQAFRNALVSTSSLYADLGQEAIGVSIDNEYYGVSIRIPFRGMFLNPTTTKRADSPAQVAISMIGTMMHELAHYRERNHGGSFASEMQDIIVVLETASHFDIAKEKSELTKFIEDNWDIFNFLHKEFRSGDYKPRGNRFKDVSAEEIRDEGAAGAMEGGRGPAELRPSLSGITGPGSAAAGQVNVGQAIDPEAEAEALDAEAEVDRTQSELDRAVAIGEHSFEESAKAEEYAKAISLLQAAQDPRKVVPYIRGLWNWMTEKQRNALVAIPPTDFLVSLASSTVPELKHTNKLLQEMAGTTQELLKAVGIMAADISRVYRANPGLEAIMNRITSISTLAEVDPSDPKAKVRSARLDKLYEDLGPDGQRIFNDVKNYFEGMSKYISKLLDDQITKSGLTIAEQANLMKKVRAMYETKGKINPYFALVRYGDYWLSVGKGKDLKFYMRESAAERDAIMQQIADERIKQKPGESSEEWEARRARNLQDLLESGEFEHGNDMEGIRNKVANTNNVLRGVFEAIDAAYGTDKSAAETRDALKDSVYQLYLQTMPQQSFRRQFIHRKGTIGFSPDFFRNTVTTATKLAIQSARLKYAPDLNNSVSQARDSIANQPKYLPYVKEMEKRVRQELTGKGPSTAEKIVGSLNKVTFIWYLGAAASALLQPLSVFQTGLPVLAAKYGHINANKELMRMLNVWSQYGYYVTNRDGSRSWVMPSVEYNKDLTPDERRAVRDMTGRDVSTSTYATEALGYKNKKISRYTSHPVVQFGKDTVNSLVLGGLMHTTERLSREALYLASYRLNRAAGKTHEEAVDNAVADTHEALGNYGSYNRPRLMKGALGKFLTQFLMYPLHVTAFLVRNFAEMIKPMDGRTRWEAVQKFFGTLFNTFILAGAVGLPLFSVVMGFLGGAWDYFKKDRPNDLRNVSYEFWWRKHWLPEQLGSTKIGGKSLADIVERGPVNALTGLDFSSRTSLNNLWLRDTKEYKNIRESAMALALEKAGPSANMILSWVEAGEAFMLGDYKKGVSKALPAGFRNFVDAYKEATEGEKDAKGVRILSKDAFTTGELLWRAAGFRSDLLANTQYVNFKVIGMEQKILNERKEISDKLDRAFRERDMKAYKDYLVEMREFDRKYPTYRIGEHLSEILGARAEQRAKSLRGVELTEKRAPMFAGALLQTRRAAAEKERAGREEK